MNAEGVAGEKGGGGSRQAKNKASRAGLPLASICLPIIAVSLRFFPFAPSMETGPRLCPWRALSDNNRSCLSMKNPNSFTSRYIKKPEQGYVFSV